MAEVVLQNVSREYPDGTLAVDSVNLEVQDREFLVLVGPSGCGKSTTLRMIAGLEEVSQGTIRIGGRQVDGMAPRDRDIAMVFQNYALYPHMNVRKNMAFGLKLRYRSGWGARLWTWLSDRGRAAELAAKRREIEPRVLAAAQTLGIEPLLERLPRQLSGGERQRVALGRAMVREPAAFLFDEPLSNLDAKLRVEMRKELKQLHRRLAATMIYVTHDQVEALTLGERIAVMDRGTIQQVGRPMDVYDHPVNRFVAGFIGTPPMNFLEGELVQASAGVRLRCGAAEIPIGRIESSSLAASIGKPVALGVRPEDVHLVPSGPVSAAVSVVEPLGDAMLIHLELDVQQENASGPQDGQPAKQLAPLIAKTDARETVAVGSRLSLEFDMQRVHWFDLESGKALPGEVAA